MKRTTISLIAVATALAAVTGLASLTAPDGGPAAGDKAAARLPVERSSLLCPAPSSSELAETLYTSFTPAGAGGAAGGGESARPTAELRPSVSVLADGDAAPAKDEEAPSEEDEESREGEDAPKAARKPAPAKPLVVLQEPGKPVAADADGGEAPALVGTATGALAPGWTAQQTTTVPAGSGRGLLGVSCTAPDTDFWFPGASLAEKRQDYVHLTNPDDTSAVADVELYGKDGRLKSTLSEGITVPPGGAVPVLLSTLTADKADDVTVHVTTRTGRVGAVVRSADDTDGSDWLAASADPAGTAVLPGIPADATSVQLVAFAPGEEDADLAVRLSGPTGTITPAGFEKLRVKSGMTATVDLKDVTKGEAGSLILGPAQADRATPVVAALRVVRGKGDKKEVAFIPAAAPVGDRATVTDNRDRGSFLSLTAPGKAAQVEVAASAGTRGGTAAVKTYTVKAGTTLTITAPVPEGLRGTYALTVRTVSGGAVHASRMLEVPDDGIPMFTVQNLPDDRGTVSVPVAEQDLSVLDD
ncbi:DUF5719 family protein [Streptomyces genisteinicus]|uniref:Secreted protein n=1 Tax=Streptomyces genisteinicus TaxID=2768068 RepID=A0A7H0HST6_9ACTN|nr:DUF5719 family protein [Streptomyces genisteinicus]QNP63602.1 hypothetical protein IAG43_12110 [Streptomyces genisteinicus]